MALTLDEILQKTQATKIDSTITGSINFHLHRLHRERWDKPLDKGPFCPVKIEIQVFADTDSTLIIFTQYAAVLEKVQEFCGSQRGLLLAGSPGIGKTSCLWYLLVESLSRSQPAILYYHESVYAFTVTAVYTLTLEDLVIFISTELQDILILVDLDWVPNDLWTSLLSPVSHAFIVAASSPNRERYKDWVKQCRIPVFVLDAPRAKIKNILPNSFPHRLRLLLNVYGPDLCQFIRLFTLEDEKLEVSIPAQIASLKGHLVDLLDQNKLQSLFSAPGMIVGEATHNLVVTYGIQSGQPSSQEMCHWIRSPLILCLVVQMARAAKITKLRSMYSLFSSSSSLSVSRGWALEVLAHELISGMTEIVLSPVSQENGHLQQTVTGTPISVPIGSRTIKIYTSGSRPDTTISPDAYYVPAEGNNPTFDAFIPGEASIAFQMFISRKHWVFPEMGKHGLRTPASVRFDQGLDCMPNEICVCHTEGVFLQG
ncbi:hypothetical protein DFH07DRAFT_764900 [Mycena maculata]|uniref:Uncharacterized protein n=1 Tax=Mycena maculata TaxID=230809 RepID=A0AAD7KCT6_9AGAR|nr:hypothetical protein DFH07DRAFT_764900 [Mycena maculata]